MRSVFPRRKLAWLALVALLNNALLPAALVVALVGPSAGRDSLWPGFCGAGPGQDIPGKAKPALLAHHCLLCIAASDVLPPDRQAGIALSAMVAGEVCPPARTTVPGEPWRNYRPQPRAPPARA